MDDYGQHVLDEHTERLETAETDDAARSVDLPEHLGDALADGLLVEAHDQLAECLVRWHYLVLAFLGDALVVDYVLEALVQATLAALQGNLLELLLELLSLLALVAVTISPGVDAFAVLLVRLPFALVDVAVSPADTAVSVLFAHLEVAFIDAAVDELLFADSVLHIVFPRPFIPLSVRVCKHSESISAATIKFARVNVTICEFDATLSLSNAVAPVAFIVGPIDPNLLAFTVLDPDHLILSMFHLTRVNGAIAKLI